MSLDKKGFLISKPPQIVGTFISLCGPTLLPSSPISTISILKMTVLCEITLPYQVLLYSYNILYQVTQGLLVNLVILVSTYVCPSLPSALLPN